MAKDYSEDLLIQKAGSETSQSVDEREADDQYL